MVGRYLPVDDDDPQCPLAAVAPARAGCRICEASSGMELHFENLPVPLVRLISGISGRSP